MAEMGLIGGTLRLPLTPLAASHHDIVRAALREAGCL
jgi:4-hydroxy-tetrahydrodipicolinate synthase